MDLSPSSQHDPFGVDFFQWFVERVTKRLGDRGERIVGTKHGRRQLLPL